MARILAHRCLHMLHMSVQAVEGCFAAASGAAAAAAHPAATPTCMIWILGCDTTSTASGWYTSHKSAVPSRLGSGGGNWFDLGPSAAAAAKARVEQAAAAAHRFAAICAVRASIGCSDRALRRGVWGRRAALAEARALACGGAGSARVAC